MRIATHVKFSVFVFLAAGAPGQTFSNDIGKPLNAAAAPSQSSTGMIVADVLNPVCRTKSVARSSAADTLVLAGHVAEGQAKFQAALEAVEAEDPADVVTRACLMNNIGFLELQRRRPELALKWFRRGLEFNPLPAAVTARLTHNLASSYIALRQLERAEEVARKAVLLAEKAFGPGHPETLFPQSTLAAVHCTRGEYARAEPIYRRILHLSEKRWGSRSYEVSIAAGNLATIYMQQGRFTEAQPLLEQSLAGLRQSPMKAVNEIPQAEMGLALSYAAGGRGPEAAMLLERALASAEANLGPADPSLASILERAANVRFLLKDHDSGRQFFERAIAVMETHYGSGSQPVLDGLERYARFLRAAKDKAGAKQLEARRKAFP